MNYFDENVLKVSIENEESIPMLFKLNENKTDFELKTEEEILNQDVTDCKSNAEISLFLENNLIYLKKYLSDTDYIISKINEANVTEDFEYLEELKTKYKDVLNNRKEYRNKIKFYEEKLSSLPQIDFYQ